MMLFKESLLSALLFPALIAALGKHGAHHTHAHAHKDHAVDLEKRFDVLSAKVSKLDSQGGDYTCGPGSPCGNGACCGESGWCGYGETYCGNGCQSNCDATAECGEFAADPNAGCPLNVCCSQYGFCGTTTEFCGDGCQSNCNQPKPNPPPSNPQQRVIGYWEGWSTQRSCGTMSAGEIPVNALTHLNIAFGYINSAFQVTNMDGLDSDVYKQVGNLKARNPSLKIMIALGGWTFSDPGPWQSVFPTLVSSAANRATFIRNLIGFMSEYGYDGVDFDWEYPGADDRGGSEGDGRNYTLLLKELQEAIAATRRDYLVTFTAPTSYWYLRHFDLKAMMQYVDWVNLMSYDLHGIWDSDNPISSQVLAHTNLTEIDLALDLFWRVDVDPSAIVLGLGFYGRTFQLTSASCWKPGCPFDGPGAGGRCTKTPGILSYQEIMEILENTGATAYLDEAAAVKYLVYADHSWVSYDDETTFAAKIEYAKRMGLSGLMIWAVDLDDNHLTALQSIVDPDAIENVNGLFDLVDLENLFPAELLPPEGTEPTWALSTVGGDMTDPNSAGFGFLLVTGDSYAVTQLRKRDGLPEPFVFIDCPATVDESEDEDKVHTARVVCLSDDVAGCFRILERGVEGTLLEMPDDCGANSLARAVSLTVSKDQYVPTHLAKRDPTSQVFDFSFDFNLSLMRRDTNNTSIRLDYSNMPGYWSSIVDSPGIQNGNADKRFFAPAFTQWEGRYGELNFKYGPQLAGRIREEIDAVLFWSAEGDCPRGEGLSFGEGFGAYVDGHIDAAFHYGFSVIGTQFPIGAADIHQASSFLKVTGSMDIGYGIGGIGVVDIASANKGNPAFSGERLIKLTGQNMIIGWRGVRAECDPYVEITYQMATMNGTDGDLADSTTFFNGRLTARVMTDLGSDEDPPVSFPSPYRDGRPVTAFRLREPNRIHIPHDDVMYDSRDPGGKIALGTFIRFGLKLRLPSMRPVEHPIDVSRLTVTCVP
jgi:chitinase